MPRKNTPLTPIEEAAIKAAGQLYYVEVEVSDLTRHEMVARLVSIVGALGDDLISYSVGACRGWACFVVRQASDGDWIRSILRAR
jgi:hypothetical protein